MLLVQCALLVAAGAFLVGCAHTYEMKIDSLAQPKPADAISYQINNQNLSIAEDSLRNREAVGFVRTALSGQGMYETTGQEKADVVVNLDYGVGPPQIHRQVVREPVYRTLPGEAHTERVLINPSVGSSPILQNVTYQDPPHTEITGYRDRVVTTVVYEKFLHLSARENQPAAEGRPPADLWTVDITSEGPSHDLRKTLPVLAAASIDYVGKDSHGQKIIRLKDSDQDIAFVKKGM